MTGDNQDISEWLDFYFCDIVLYWGKIEGDHKLGRWLGVYHCVEIRLWYWIMTAKGDIISITTVKYLTEYKVAKEGVQEEICGYTSIFHQTI